MLRNLRTASGAKILGPKHSKVPSRLNGTLKKAKVSRGRSLYAAWDFTVASEKSLTQRMLHIRDDAFGQLGDKNLADVKVAGARAQVRGSNVEDFTPDQNANIARRVTGTFTVPVLPRQARLPARVSFHYGANGLPAQLAGNTTQANSSASSRARRRPRRRRA